MNPNKTWSPTTKKKKPKLVKSRLQITYIRLQMVAFISYLKNIFEAEPKAISSALENNSTLSMHSKRHQIYRHVHDALSASHSWTIGVDIVWRLRTAYILNRFCMQMTRHDWALQFWFYTHSKQDATSLLAGWLAVRMRNRHTTVSHLTTDNSTWL